MLKRKLTAIFLSAAMTAATGAELTNVSSDTALSRRIEALQQRFGAAVPGVRIAVMDKDWFQQNAILNGVRPHQVSLNPAEKGVIQQMAADYVRTRTQTVFAPEAFAGLEHDLLTKEGASRRFSYRTSAGSQAFCVLFPHAADQSRDQYYAERITRNASIHGALADAPLRNPLDYELMKRFTDYHEIGHCYDRWFNEKPAAGQSAVSIAESRHKMEVFGEVFANLMLARDGYHQFSGRLADIRLATAAFYGPITAATNSPSEVGYHMTYAYLLHEGSRNAEKEIERLGTARLQRMSLEQILELSRDITLRSVLNAEDTPDAVGYMMKKRYDISGFESMRSASPRNERVYQTMVKLRDDMEAAVRRVYDFGRRDTPVLQRASFDFSNVITDDIPAAVLQARTTVLATGLRQSLGGNLTNQNLVQAYQRQKDALRQQLQTGDVATQQQARTDLSLMQMALKRVYDSLPQNQMRPRVGAQGVSGALAFAA